MYEVSTANITGLDEEQFNGAKRRGVKERLFEVFLCCNLFRAKDEWLILSREPSKHVRAMHEVADEHVRYSNCA